MNIKKNIFQEFIQFLKNNNILATIIATVMSTYITQLTTSFTDDIIMPIIYRDSNNDGKVDIKKIEDYEFKMSGIKFKIGKFSIVLLKVLIVFVGIFLLKKYVVGIN